MNLLQGTLAGSIPIMLGALTGVICSRSGVINIAIEGQLLLGAFTAAIVASGTGSLWLGLISGALAGSLVGALLAAFAIGYRVDQVVLGVVINTLILGLTGYLYDDLMIPYQNTLNSPATFSAIKIPLLGDIPIVGPVFFDSTIFLYLTYIALAGVQVGLFSTRWGLRTRAIGEHPVAADTVGIRVTAMRYRNVIAAGVIAGIGGAYFTIGSVGSFGKGMSSGEGYIALAAMIFGRYNAVRRDLGGPAVRLRDAAAVDPVHPEHADPVQPAADGPVHRHDHRAGRAGGQGPRPQGRGHPLRQGMIFGGASLRLLAIGLGGAVGAAQLAWRSRVPTGPRVPHCATRATFARWIHGLAVDHWAPIAPPINHEARINHNLVGSGWYGGGHGAISGRMR